MDLEFGLERMALTVISNRFVLLTGGQRLSDRRTLIGSASELTFFFDAVTGEWDLDPKWPDLVKPRFNHGSCSSSTNAFVFGGHFHRHSLLRDIELLSLYTKEGDFLCRTLPKEWTNVWLPISIGKINPLMATVNDSCAIILAGTRHLTDTGSFTNHGTMFNPENPRNKSFM